MNRIFTLTACLMFWLSPMLAYSAPQDGRALLEQAMQYAAQTQSLGIQLTIQPDGTIVENPASYKIAMQILLEGAKNAYVEMKVAGQEVQMYENGKERSYYHAHKGWHKPARSASREKMIGEALGGPLAVIPTWMGGFLHQSSSILSNATVIEYIDAKPLAGIETHHVFIEYPDYNVDVFLKQDNLIPINTTFTLREFSSAAPEELGRRKGGKVECITNTWQPGVRFSPEMFAYQRPMTDKPDAPPTADAPPPPSHSFRNMGQAPPIRLEFLNGGTFDLASYRGSKAVVIDFWASWCGPCKKSLPVLDKLNKEMRLRNVEIVTINLDDSISIAKTYVQSNDLRLPVAFDAKNEAARNYKANSIPTLVVVSKDGDIIHYERGVPKDYEPKMRNLLLALEQGRP